MRVLFFNEGNLGTQILGQRQLDISLQAGLATSEGVEARFAALGPLGRASRALAIRPVPGLAARNLDLRTLRYHLVQSVRARHALTSELAWSPDVVLMHSQSIALLAEDVMRRLPVALSVDASIEDWARMPAWAATRGRRRETAASALLERRALQAAALVLAWTPWAARGLERTQPRAHVVVHHPGIDLERFRPAAQRAPRERPRVLFVGGRFREKGGEDLLAALASRLGADVELDLVTPAPVAPVAGVRVHRLQAEDPALLELHQQADVLCLPTYGDASPWVVLEAMACGTAVVGSDVGGIPDLLDRGRAGLVVRHGDVRELSEALTQLLADEPARLALAARARERCLEHYDARRQFARLVQLLGEQVR